MKKVITFGSFDIVHSGHEYYLSEAKSLGDFLITIVARDINIKKIKGRLPKYSENIRLDHVKGLGISDLVELGHQSDVLSGIRKHRPDIIAIGYDQTSFLAELKKYLSEKQISSKIVLIDSHRPDIYKSSKIRG